MLNVAFPARRPRWNPNRNAHDSLIVHGVCLCHMIGFPTVASLGRVAASLVVAVHVRWIRLLIEIAVGVTVATVRGLIGVFGWVIGGIAASLDSRFVWRVATGWRWREVICSPLTLLGRIALVVPSIWTHRRRTVRIAVAVRVVVLAVILAAVSATITSPVRFMSGQTTQPRARSISSSRPATTAPSVAGIRAAPTAAASAAVMARFFVAVKVLVGWDRIVSVRNQASIALAISSHRA